MQAEITFVDKPEKRVIPIVPYSVKGKFRNLKSLILLIAFSVYFLTPWLKWHGATRTGQALLFDIGNSRFYFFDLVIFPQDLMIFMAIMVVAAALLFISATLYGRIFCGFFCFQTIWTDAFRCIEKLIQGEAPARNRLRKQVWNLEKIYKLSATHVLWLLLAFATALNFTLYFADAHTLLVQIFSGEAAMAAYTTIVTLTATTYAAAGIAKEDICRVACPYGKFQTVMQDPMTKTVVYDTQRGERALGRATPSKALKEIGARQQKGYGDCIDCGYCVNVCPTGVDIRKGFQIDCISCGLCIDACDNIMTSMHLPTGLIRFDQMLQSPTNSVKPEQARSNNLSTFTTLKKAGYFSILALAIGFIVYQVEALEPFSATIQQQGQPLVTRLSNGDLKSRYVIRLMNKSAATEQYTLQIQGLPLNAISGSTHFEVPPGKTYTYTLNLVLPEATAKTINKFSMIVVPNKSPDRSKHYALGYVSGI